MKRFFLNFGFWAFALVWNPIITGVITLVFFPSDAPLASFAVSLCIGTCVMLFCYGAVYLAEWVDKRFARARGLSSPQRHNLWRFSFAILAMPAGLMLAFAIVTEVGAFFGITIGTMGPRQWRFGLFIGSLIAGGFFLLMSLLRARESMQQAELRASHAETGQLKAQLSALSAQMNPHVLFNALNTVAALIPADPTRAEETVVQLAELYRGVLKGSQSATFLLADELRLCRAYLDIERVRFGERIAAEIKLQDGIDAATVEVPALLLQPIVENAIKHGLSASAGGRVDVLVSADSERLELRVTDNGVGMGNSKHSGTGLGLANARERLRLLYGDSASLTVTEATPRGTCVIIAMPRRPAAGGAT